MTHHYGFYQVTKVKEDCRLLNFHLTFVPNRFKKQNKYRRYYLLKIVWFMAHQNKPIQNHRTKAVGSIYFLALLARV